MHPRDLLLLCLTLLCSSIFGTPELPRLGIDPGTAAALSALLLLAGMVVAAAAVARDRRKE